MSSSALTPFANEESNTEYNLTLQTVGPFSFEFIVQSASLPTDRPGEDAKEFEASSNSVCIMLSEMATACSLRNDDDDWLGLDRRPLRREDISLTSAICRPLSITRQQMIASLTRQIGKVKTVMRRSVSRSLTLLSKTLRNFLMSREDTTFCH